MGLESGRHCFCMKSQCVHCFKIPFASYASLPKQFTASKGWQMLRCNQQRGEDRGKEREEIPPFSTATQNGVKFSSSREFPVIPRDALTLKFLGMVLGGAKRKEWEGINIFWAPDATRVALSPLSSLTLAIITMFQLKMHWEVLWPAKDSPSYSMSATFATQLSVVPNAGLRGLGAQCGLGTCSVSITQELVITRES